MCVCLCCILHHSFNRIHSSALLTTFASFSSAALRSLFSLFSQSSQSWSVFCPVWFVARRSCVRSRNGSPFGRSVEDLTCRSQTCVFFGSFLLCVIGLYSSCCCCCSIKNNNFLVLRAGCGRVREGEPALDLPIFLMDWCGG